MATRYERQQTGALMHVAAAIVAALVIVAFVAGDEFWLALVIGLFVCAVLLLLGRLTVRVTDAEVALWFGAGVIRRRWPVADIAAAQRVRNPWTWGWGVRWFPGGWLYNVSGLDAVELRLHDGGRIRIGTDRPDELLHAITAALGSR